MEQTSSAAYPNILAVDYVKKARVANTKILMKAEKYLNVGYQKLLTFERPGGGFDWWGRGEPLVWLSAYGLMEFSDMARVYPIDRGVIDRTQAYLMRQQNKDGTWDKIGGTHGETIQRMGNPKLLLTSYVSWSLLESGMPKSKLTKSIQYIRDNIADGKDNAYVLALAANALAAYDAKDDSTLQVLQKLEKLHEDMPKWKARCYPAKGQSLTYSRGGYINVETTAMTVLAMVKTGVFTNSVNQSLTYLIKTKEANGTWGNTQATILALKALLAGMDAPTIKGKIDFTILVNGKEAAQGNVTQDNAEVMQLFDLQEQTQIGANNIEIKVGGETPLMYQIVGRHFEPWTKVTRPVKKPMFAIDVKYDRTKLRTHDMLKAQAKVTYNGDAPANMVMVELGIAPGFNVDAGEFAELVGQKKIQRFDLTASRVILYLDGMRPGQTQVFDYAMKARFPVRAQTPTSTVYEYYTPTNRATAQPVLLTVSKE